MAGSENATPVPPSWSAEQSAAQEAPIILSRATGRHRGRGAPCTKACDRSSAKARPTARAAEAQVMFCTSSHESAEIDGALMLGAMVEKETMARLRGVEVQRSTKIKAEGGRFCGSRV
jgi:hypothetical protein